MKRSVIQNNNVTHSSKKVDEIINALKAIPKEYDDIEDIVFKDIFSRAVIVNKSLIYFVVGNSGKLLPIKPKVLYFKSSIEYTIRKTKRVTNFGLII